MSHLPAATPALPMSDGPYASLASAQDDREAHDGDVSPLMEKAIEAKVSVSDIAKPLRTSSTTIASLLIDVISTLVSIAFRSFALIGYRASGNVVGSKERKLLDIAKIAATLFPYGFALVLGRTLQNLLSWRLERGIDCLSFAYLSRSFTLGSAYLAPLRIRYPHWLPVVLFAAWAFSPLGSQGLLRFISLQQGTVTTQLMSPMKYVYPQGTGSASCAGDCALDTYDAMFLASLQSLTSTGQSSQDAWGNIKIPLLEGSGSAASTNKWREVSGQADQHYYSSIIGIPFSIPQGPGNLTFKMKSWYWLLDNATLWEPHSEGPLLEGAFEYDNSSLLRNVTADGGLWQFVFPENLNLEAASSIPMTFEVAPSAKGSPLRNELNVTYTYGINETHDVLKSPIATRLDAAIIQKPVELNVTCAASACNVTAIRDINMDANYDSATDRNLLANYAIPRFTKAFPLEHTGTPEAGAFEGYLCNPLQNPWRTLSDQDIDLTRLNAENLALRISQILNAYWIVANEEVNAVGGFDVRDYGLVLHDTIRNSTVTSQKYEDFLYCDNLWASILCASILIMLSATMASTFLSCSRLAPDYTDFLSALTLTNGRILLEGGSCMDEYERIGVLKDVKLKIGDIKQGEQVGRVAITPVGEAGDLKKGRLYW